MRVLVTTFPGLGHFHPLAPLARALQQRGHDVLVATGPDLVDWVERCGLTATAVGLTQDEAVQRAKELSPAGESFAVTMFTAVAPQAVLADLEPIAQRFRPDVVIHEEAEYAGPVVADVLGAPWVTHSWAAPAVPTDMREATERRLSPLWAARSGSPPRVTGDLYLDACPPPLQSAEASSIPGRTLVRAVPFEGSSSETSEDLGDLARPAAYVGFGTVAEFSRPERLVEVTRAVADVMASVVLTTGPSEIDAVAGFVPGNVVVRRYIPLRDVLTGTDVVVSHGGAGTTVAALVAGRPHLVLPQGAPSQSRNAAAITACGAGLALEGEAQISDAIRSAVAQLVAEPKFAARATAVAAELAALPAPDDVAQLIAARYA